MKVSRIVLVIGLLSPTFHFACKPVTGNENLKQEQINSTSDSGIIENTATVTIQDPDKSEENVITKPRAVDENSNAEDVDLPTSESSTDVTTLIDSKPTDGGLTNNEIENSINNIAKNEDVEKAENLKAPDHSSWDILLNKYVKAGKVDYASFKKDQEFGRYLALLADNPPQSSWSRDEQLAYWINTYNAFTIKLIIDNYPVKSIMDIHGGKPWDVKWIKLGNKSYSLNQIENEIIRPQFNEPRIHFAVNCAAKSCPPIAAKAFTPANLEQLLEKQTIEFINDTEFNNISNNQLKLSKIFEWYSSDFGNLIDFINTYSKKSASSEASVSFLEYDWALNGK